MAIFEDDELEKMIGKPELERIRDMDKIKAVDIEKRKRIEAARAKDIAELNSMLSNDKL